jgi:hypothetical protein
MGLEAPLDRVQRWMHAVVVHPGTAPEAVASDAAREQFPPEALPELILPSATLTPVERVEIYHGMYLLRMEEALASDYPALKHFLGDGRFFDLVRDYVQVFPSRSHSLNRLGDHVPEYVLDAPGLPRRAFCHDLATLELALSQVFDAPATPALDADQVAATPAGAWETTRLRPIEAFRLLALRYPVNDYVQSLKSDDHDHPAPRLKRNWVAVYRRSYGVYRLSLGRAAYDLLSDLAAGRPLGEALTAALKRGGRRGPREDELFRWFRDWVSEGLFQSLPSD